MIRVGHDTHRVVDAAEAALAASEADVYVRGGALVRPIRDGRRRRGIKREEGSTTIRIVERATLHELLTRHTSFVRYDGRRDKDVATAPPIEVVQALLARGDWPSLRPLRGVLETPAIRPDGSVIQTAGYDDETGYLYQPNGIFDAVPECPTLDDAERAREMLYELIADFPFAGAESRAAWLAALLTLFARPAIDGCTPLFAIDATTPGTGKGLLSDVIANIATGRDGTKAIMPSDDEEFRKRISALLVEGDQLAVLDNVKGTLASTALDACLTSTRWKDRTLGRTGTLTVENQLVWLATVNNLSLGADTARRTIHVRLETALEHPELREDFRHDDILGHVREHRSRLVPLVLTILVAHARAGRPKAGAAVLGGFARWSAIVASACAWCGAGDPIATQRQLASVADTVRGTLYPLLEGLARLTVEGALTCREILARLYPAPGAPDGFDDLRAAIEELATPSGKQAPSAHRLGNALRKFRGRVIQGRTVIAEVDGRNTLRWRVAAPGAVLGQEAPNGVAELREAQGAFDDML